MDLTLSVEQRTPPRGPDPGPEPQQPAPPVDTSPDAVLRRCEQISADLRSKLGSHEGDRCAADQGLGFSQGLRLGFADLALQHSVLDAQGWAGKPASMHGTQRRTWPDCHSKAGDLEKRFVMQYVCSNMCSRRLSDKGMEALL